eukprot:scaffold189091_cov30-Tisochrysis_lutea.AAC.1
MEAREGWAPPHNPHARIHETPAKSDPRPKAKSVKTKAGSNESAATARSNVWPANHAHELTQLRGDHRIAVWITKQQNDTTCCQLP